MSKFKRVFCLQQIRRPIHQFTFVFISFFLFQGILLSQSGSYITDSGRGKYTYQLQTKKLHKFKDELSQDSVTLDLFNKFNRPRKAQVILNSIGGGLAIGTLSLTTEVADDSALGALIVAMLGTASTGAVVVLGNLLTGPRKAKAKRELIEHINLGNTDYSTALSQGFKYATPITYDEQEKVYSLNSVESKFYLLENEIRQDNYSNAEFENYLIFRKRQHKALLFSYTFGSVVLVSQILDKLNVVDEDTARGQSYRLFTIAIPVVSALGSVAFSIVFAKRKVGSRERLISYINGEDLSFNSKTPRINLMGGITQNGLTLSLQF